MECSETFHWDSASGQSRPDKAGQPSGSESCVAVGQPTLRSVDSEWAGRVIEPRNVGNRGSRRRQMWRKTTPKRGSGRARGSHRGRRAGHVHGGVLQDLGGPVASVNESGFGDAGEQLQARSRSVLQLRERNPRRGAVPRSEGNEATREDRLCWRVATVISYCEHIRKEREQASGLILN